MAATRPRQAAEDAPKPGVAVDEHGGEGAGADERADRGRRVAQFGQQHRQERAPHADRHENVDARAHRELDAERSRASGRRGDGPRRAPRPRPSRPPRTRTGEGFGGRTARGRPPRALQGDGDGERHERRRRHGREGGAEAGGVDDHAREHRADQATGRERGREPAEVARPRAAVVDVRDDRLGGERREELRHADQQLRGGHRRDARRGDQQSGPTVTPAVPTTNQRVGPPRSTQRPAATASTTGNTFGKATKAPSAVAPIARSTAKSGTSVPSIESATVADPIAAQIARKLRSRGTGKGTPASGRRAHAASAAPQGQTSHLPPRTLMLDSRIYRAATTSAKRG